MFVVDKIGLRSAAGIGIGIKMDLPAVRANAHRGHRYQRLGCEEWIRDNGVRRGHGKRLEEVRS